VQLDLPTLSAKQVGPHKATHDFEQGFQLSQGEVGVGSVMVIDFLVLPLRKKQKVWNRDSVLVVRCRSRTRTATSGNHLQERHHDDSEDEDWFYRF
jgi:hypothetical protein